MAFVVSNLLRLFGLAVIALSAPDVEPTCENCAEMGASLLQTKSSGVAKVERSAAEVVRTMVPELQSLGLETFGSPEAFEKAVDESVTLNINFADIPLTLRIKKQDSAQDRLGKLDEVGAEYGIDSLLAVRESDKDMLNMIDIGGNFGAVSIALYNKFPGLVRAVVVEPMAKTYFFMRWNMWLNGIHHMTKKEFLQNPNRPGVVALNRAVTEKDGDQLQMCAHPDWSMEARSPTIDGIPCDCDHWICTSVKGVSPGSLLQDYFGEQKISLLKLDCEGCEIKALPALASHPGQILRFAGELHVPEEHLIDIACNWDEGKYFTKVCRTGKSWEWKFDSSMKLGCGDKKRPKCKWDMK